MGSLLLYDPLIMGHHLVYAENFADWGLSRGLDVHFLGIHFEGSLFHRRFANRPAMTFHAFDPDRFAHRAHFDDMIREFGEVGFYYDKLRSVLFEDDGPAVQVAALKDLQARLKPDLTLVLYGDEMWEQWEAMAQRGEGFAFPTYLWLLYAAGRRYDPYGLNSHDLEGFLARQNIFSAVATSDEYQAARLDTPQSVLRYVPDPYRRLGPAEELSEAEAQGLGALRGFLDTGNGPVLLAPGLLEARKNALWLLGAAGAATDVSLVALGRRNLPPDEEERARRVFDALAAQGRFFGLGDYVPDIVLETALASPRVRILPLPYRRHDLSSGIQLMALRQGLPCLVPDNGLMARRTLEHGLGEVFAHESAEDFAAAARLLADYPRERHAGACQDFAQHFTREAFFAGADRFFGLTSHADPDPLVADAARRNRALLDAASPQPRRSAWHLHKALLLHERDRPEESLACLDKARSLSPGATRPTFLRAAFLESAGRADLAHPLLERLWAARPGHLDVAAWIAAQSEKVVKRLPDKRARVDFLAGLGGTLGQGGVFAALLDAVCELVWYHIHRDRHELAEAILLDVLAVWPGRPLAVSVLALNQVEAGFDHRVVMSWQDVDTLLRDALDREPDNQACLLARWERLNRNGSFDEGAAAFADLNPASGGCRAVGVKPAFPADASQIRRGYALYDALHANDRQHPHLRSLIDKVCDCTVKPPLVAGRVRRMYTALRARMGKAFFTELFDIAVDRMWAYIDRHEHQRAQAILAELHAVEPRAGLAVSLLVFNRVVAGAGADGLLSWKRLADLLDDLLAQEPGNVPCLRARAELLVQTGRLDAAVAAYADLIDTHGELSAYLNQSDVLRRAGRFDEAEAALERAFALGVCDADVLAVKAGRIANARAEALAETGLDRALSG